MSELISDIAARLRVAEETQSPIAPFTPELSPNDYAAAYAIQRTNFEHWQNAGRTCIGRKIGLTSKKVQAQLGVDQPDYGALFADTQIADGGSMPVNDLIAPRVEAELALILRSDITDPDISLNGIAMAVDWVIPAIEIVDSRISDWKIGILDTIADNGASARYVLGAERKSLDQIDLITCQMSLSKNGESASTGSGADCLGNPLIALQWLATTLIAHNAPLRAGDLVLTGALGPMVAANVGDTFEANIEGFAPVRVSFT